MEAMMKQAWLPATLNERRIAPAPTAEKKMQIPHFVRDDICGGCGLLTLRFPHFVRDDTVGIVTATKRNGWS
jgi:hypothetical protein